MLQEKSGVIHRIEKQLQRDSRVETAHMKVKWERASGCILLEGTVQSFTAMRAAENDALSESRGETVENHLTVDPDAFGIVSMTGETARRNVYSALAVHSDIVYSDLYISFQAGFLIIKGSVKSLREKKRVTEICTALLKMEHVLNKLVALPSGSSGDRRLSEQIMMSLENIPGNDIAGVDIEIREGRVLLSGSVPDPVMCMEILRRIRSAAGVVSVRDRLSVEYIPY